MFKHNEVGRAGSSYRTFLQELHETLTKAIEEAESYQLHHKEGSEIALRQGVGATIYARLLTWESIVKERIDSYDDRTA